MWPKITEAQKILKWVPSENEVFLQEWNFLSFVLLGQ